MSADVLYIQCKDGLPINSDIMVAAQGFEWMGYEIHPFEYTIGTAPFSNNVLKKNTFVGGIECMRQIFTVLDKMPSPINFPSPNADAGLLGRELEYLTLHLALQKFTSERKPFYIKPFERKLFDAILLSKEHQASYFREHRPDTPVIISEPLEIVSEWRTFVHHQKMIDCRSYNGNFRLHPDYDFIQANIDAYKNSPVSYTLDVAVLKNRQTVVMEFDDFWAVGAYGLDQSV
jgi:ATP-grasp domain, R2K clade family 2